MKPTTDIRTQYADRRRRAAVKRDPAARYAAAHDAYLKAVEAYERYRQITAAADSTDAAINAAFNLYMCLSDEYIAAVDRCMKAVNLKGV